VRVCVCACVLPPCRLCAFFRATLYVPLYLCTSTPSHTPLLPPCPLHSPSTCALQSNALRLRKRPRNRQQRRKESLPWSYSSSQTPGPRLGGENLAIQQLSTRHFANRTAPATAIGILGLLSPQYKRGRCSTPPKASAVISPLVCALFALHLSQCRPLLCGPSF